MFNNSLIDIGVAEFEHFLHISVYHLFIIYYFLRSTYGSEWLVHILS
jgi:hypothetical protein